MQNRVSRRRWQRFAKSLYAIVLILGVAACGNRRQVPVTRILQATPTAPPVATETEVPQPVPTAQARLGPRASRSDNAPRCTARRRTQSGYQPTTWRRRAACRLPASGWCGALGMEPKPRNRVA